LENNYRKTTIKLILLPLYIPLSANTLLGCFMENRTSPQKNSPTPRETFERALELVRNQTMMREDIMRFSLESAIRLQENRGPIMLYGL